MAHGRISRDRGRKGALTRLVMIACAGALLAWAVVPSGAGGQQYPLPTATATSPQPPKAAPLPLLSPFPIVRIVGNATKTGTDITLLTVRARVGSYVVSRCVGQGQALPL